MLGHLTDMARSDEEIKEDAPLAVEPNKYPYGLHISLSKDELAKLGADPDSFELHGVYHIQALVKVDSISSHESSNGENCTVGMQITHLAMPESEDAEGEEEGEEPEEGESEEPDLSQHGYLRYGR